jgi:hypothetical protein
VAVAGATVVVLAAGTVLAGVMGARRVGVAARAVGGAEASCVATGVAAGAAAQAALSATSTAAHSHGHGADMRW